MAGFLRLWKRNKPSSLACVLTLFALGGVVVYLSSYHHPSAPDEVSSARLVYVSSSNTLVNYELSL